MSNAELLYTTLAQRYPEAADLAVLSSMPIRVSPAFLRAARLRLLDASVTGSESDLWLSDLVEARSVAGFSFRPEVRQYLRSLLAAKPNLLNQVWQQVHSEFAQWLSPRLRLEEELTWRLLSNPADPEIDRHWQSVLSDMENSDNAEGVARWAIRAIDNLPVFALDNPLAKKAWIGAHLLLGDIRILGDEPQHFFASGEFEFATRRLPPRRIQIGMIEKGLMLSPLEYIENGHEIDIPHTQPLWMQLETPNGEAIRVLTVEGNDDKTWEIDADEVVLRFINGAAYHLALRQAEQAQGQEVRAPRVNIEYEIERNGQFESVSLPLVAGVMSNLSGHEASSMSMNSGERQFFEINRDNFDQYMKSISPTLEYVYQGSSGVLLRGGEYREKTNLALDQLTQEDSLFKLIFTGMADFLPNALLKKCPWLNRLLQARDILKLITLPSNPDSKLLRQVQAIFGKNSEISFEKKLDKYLPELLPSSKSKEYTAIFRSKEFSACRSILVNVLFHASEAMFNQSKNKKIDVNDVKSILVAAISKLEFTLSHNLDLILRDEDFRRLESAWRGLDFLVSRAESNESLKIEVLNISLQELQEEMYLYKQSASDSILFREMYEKPYSGFSGEPFTYLLGDYYFDQSDESTDILALLAEFAAELHAPFISAVDASILDTDFLTQRDAKEEMMKQSSVVPQNVTNWDRLRESGQAQYLCLTLPRFLARLPYGTDDNPIAEFFYEENIYQDESAALTWINSAYALASNINRAFSRFGWCSRIFGETTGGVVTDLTVSQIPLSNGGPDSRTAVERYLDSLTERQLLDNGINSFIPLSYTDTAVFNKATTLRRSLSKGEQNGDFFMRLGSPVQYQLSTMLAVSRFVHYIKLLAREYVNVSGAADALQELLNERISQYVMTEAAQFEEVKARYPLAEARIDIEYVEDRRDEVLAIIYLRPQYQIDDLNESIRVKTKLPLASPEFA